MDQERGFLKAIAEHPDDDLHRLAWADWLDDTGQADRAAFVRAQLRLAALPDDDPARDALEDEADDLLAVHEQQWIGRVQHLVLAWQWRRGFCERVVMDSYTFLEKGEELFGLAPIRELRLLAQADHLPLVARCAELQRIEALDLSQESRTNNRNPGYGELTNRPLMALLGSPHLKRLTSLELRGLGAEWPVLQTLIETGLLDRLRRLDLRGCRGIGARASNELARTGASQLEALDLTATNVLIEGLWTLMRSERFPRLHEVGDPLPGPRVEELRDTPVFSRLTALTLAGHIPGGAGWERLLRLLPAGQLQKLSLAGSALDLEQVKALANCANLEGLRVLQLPWAQLRDGAASMVAGSPWLGRLTKLDLSGNTIGSPGLRAVVDSPNLPQLRELEMAGNYVGTAGVKVLTSGDRPRRLTLLDLKGTNLDGESARYLAGSPALSRLRILRLDNNLLGDEGVKVLANSPHLRRLRELGLASNSIDTAGVEALLASRTLGWRMRLGVSGAALSQREREMLRQRFGAEIEG